MSALALREFHRFEAGGGEFVYLVPSAAVFMLDDAASAILGELNGGALPESDLIRRLVRPLPGG